MSGGWGAIVHPDISRSHDPQRVGSGASSPVGAIPRTIAIGAGRGLDNKPKDGMKNGTIARLSFPSHDDRLADYGPFTGRNAMSLEKGLAS